MQEREENKVHRREGQESRVCRSSRWFLVGIGALRALPESRRGGVSLAESINTAFIGADGFLQTGTDGALESLTVPEGVVVSGRRGKWTLLGGSVEAAVGRMAAKRHIRERGWRCASTPKSSRFCPSCKCPYIQLWRFIPPKDWKTLC